MSRLRLILLTLVVLAVAAAGIYFLLGPNFSLTQAALLGPPIRVNNRVYMLTGQWRSVGSKVRYTDLMVDLWALDASTLQPVFRRRVQKVPNGAMIDRSILGVHNKTLWIALPDGPYAANIDSGAITATPTQLQTINPALKTFLPTDARYYTLTTSGLAVKASDGRTYWFDPRTFQANQTPPPPTKEAVKPAYYVPQSYSSFLERGLSLGTKWLGLLNPQEAAQFTSPVAMRMPGLDYHSRRALYSLDITEGKTFFGMEPRYSNFKALTAEFLAPGILSEHRPTGGGVPILRRDPDSVFVVHLDRLGEEGRLHLTRIAGPEGKPLWTAPLSLTFIQSFLPAEESLLFFGVLYNRQDPKVPGDPMHTASGMIVAVDWKSGAVKTLDLSDVTKHPEARLLQ